MIEQKQLWSLDMKPADLNKYHCSIQIVTEGFMEDYEDADLRIS